MERRGGGERLPEMDTFQRGIKKKIILPRRLARSGYVVSIGWFRRNIRLLTTVADRSKNPIQKGPRPTPLTGRKHVGGGRRGKSSDPVLGSLGEGSHRR
jgi:hypothetical protein